MKKAVWLFPFLFAASLFAQNDAIQGYCDRGGTHALVSGLPATNWQLGNIPACTVTVYLTGTTTKATLYADSLGTPLGNPFTATTSTSPNPGYWIFWAPVGQGYDVTMSGGGGVPSCTTQPNCYAIPITKTDLKVGGGGGGGAGVTNFSAGNMPPLFTTTVTNPTTTPNLSFLLSNASAQSMFGNFTGVTGPPFYANYTCTGLLTCTFNSGSNVINFNVPNTSALSITATSPIRVNGGNGPVSSGTANIDCPTCGSPNLKMVVNPPISGQYAVVYPTTGTITSDPPGLSSIFANGDTAAGGYFAWTCSGLLCSIAGNTQAHWSGFSLPSYINPANVTAIYADAITSAKGVLGDYTDSYSGTTLNCNSQEMMVSTSAYPYQPTEVSALTGLTGATFNSTAACNIQVGGSGPGTHGQGVDVTAVRFLVFYTGTPPPVDGPLHLDPPLGYDLDRTALFLDTSNLPAISLTSYSVSFLPPPAVGAGTVRLVFNSSDCQTIDNIGHTLCYSNGSTWNPTTTSGGGGSGTYFTETVSCTTGCTLAHTPTTFLNLSRNGLVQIYTTDFTRSGVTITLVDPAVTGDVFYAQYYY